MWGTPSTGLVARVVLHAAVLMGPPALLSYAMGAGSPSAGLCALGLWVLGTTGEDRGVGVERRVPRFEQGRALLLLGFLWAVGMGSGSWRPVAPWVASFGALVLGSGLALRRWAIVTLGPRFRASIHSPGPRIHSGPYAWLAHPSEVGLGLATLGLAVISGSVPAVLLWPVCVGLPGIWRARQEDRAWSWSGASHRG